MFLRSLRVIIFFLFLINGLFAKKELIESQPEIPFKFEKLQRTQKNLELQVAFNKAVFLLNKKKYEDAITIFKKTSKIIKVPSILNIAIAYYKLGSVDNAVIYLNKIYENQDLIYDYNYSYMSSAYYLYKISKDTKYLDTIVKVSKKSKKLSDHSNRMLVDTYILLGNYKKALKVIKKISYPLYLKEAILNMKIRNFKEARVLLEKAKENTVNPEKTDEILWFIVYVDLKMNEIAKLKDDLEEVYKRRVTFKTNLKLPLEIYFNKDKYTPKEYINFVLKFDLEREIDFIYYFAPFIFSDSQEIIYDSVKGFIINNSENLSDLENMVDYNAKFLNLIKLDPIIRVIELKKLLNEDTKSYVYYNLALSFAQINDFNSAYEYFTKAFKLNPGNKLYAMMTLLTAKRVNIKVKDLKYIDSIIRSKNGIYNSFGKELYKMFINPKYEYSNKNNIYKNTIFSKAMDYLNKARNDDVTLKHPLFDEHLKDPFTYLMKLVHRKAKENDYSYFARLQDTVPLKINDNFLDGPLIITKYYLDILKAIGLFHKADMNMVGKKTPSYLRLKALRDLHFNKADEAIKTIEYLQKEYSLEDKYTMYLLVASFLEASRYNDASIQISLIKALLNDNESSFLTAVQLIQELKISSATQYLKEPYNDSFIDFKLIGLDKYLELL